MIFNCLTQTQWVLPILLFPSLSFQTMFCPAPSPRLSTPAYASCLAALGNLLLEGQRENHEWPFRWRPQPVRTESPRTPYDQEPDGRYCGKTWSGSE